MNPSDSSQKSIPETTQPPAEKPESKAVEVDHEAIDKHMRMAGRMLYDIILDWVKAQPGYSEDESTSGEPAASERRES